MLTLVSFMWQYTIYNESTKGDDWTWDMEGKMSITILWKPVTSKHEIGPQPQLPRPGHVVNRRVFTRPWVSFPVLNVKVTNKHSQAVLDHHETHDSGHNCFIHMSTCLSVLVLWSRGYPLSRSLHEANIPTRAAASSRYLLSTKNARKSCHWPSTELTPIHTVFRLTNCLCCFQVWRGLKV